MLTLHNIQVVKGERSILAGVDLSIAPHQVTVVIGPNGAGKTTLLKVCTGDEKLAKGTVLLDNKPIDDYSIHALARARAVMTQSYDMNFAFTVEEIVMMGCFVYEERLPKGQQQAIVDEVMELMEIGSLATRHFTSLSGGEQQRTQLARVLAQLWYPNEQDTPRFLMLDEPTASLDIYHQYQVLSLAKELSQRNIGVLAVIHDLALAASFADYLVLMEKGQIAASGVPETVLTAENLKRVYNIRAEYFRPPTDKYPSVLIDKD